MCYENFYKNFEKISNFFFAIGLVFERFLAPRSQFFEKVNGLGVLGRFSCSSDFDLTDNTSSSVFVMRTRTTVALSWRILANKSFSSFSVTPNRLVKSSFGCLDRPDIWCPSPLPSGHTAAEIDGKSIANEIKATLATEVCNMKNSIGKVPGLGLILVGKRKDSLSFVRIKKKACEQVRIASVIIQLPEDCTQDEVLNVISTLNHKESVHGILVQLPIPNHLCEERIIKAVNVEKDVDGFHPVNMGNLAMTGREPLFVPCASRGCIEVLNRCNVEILGKKAVVIGRSMIGGLPTSLLLQRHHATVTVVHAFTKNPEEITCEADILVSNVGVPNFVRGHWLKPGVVVIDMGSTLVKEKNSSHVIGDVCYEEAIRKASAITPVPGGVGPVTISMLLFNTLEAAKRAYQWTQQS
ncbi:hypothetical protein LXL04_014216 [Taraxacum kok-saghyz]